MTIQIIAAFGTLILLTLVLYVLVARPRINHWGATDQEHQARRVPEISPAGQRTCDQQGYGAPSRAVVL
jgi:hypothetical protein